MFLGAHVTSGCGSEAPDVQRIRTREEVCGLLSRNASIGACVRAWAVQIRERLFLECDCPDANCGAHTQLEPVVNDQAHVIAMVGRESCERAIV